MPDREPGQVHLDNRCVLYDREAQVVRLLLTGHRVPEIAKQLFLSQSTVRNHLSSVFRKLRVNSQQELTLLFHELWREEGTRPTGLGAEVLRQARALCTACRTPWWR
jgi:DNA-binding NarL/FixJ family response regulator